MQVLERTPASSAYTLATQNAPEASCRLSFAVTSRLFFQSRGPVEDDGNGPRTLLAGLEFVVIRKRFRPPYIVGKEGESRDSWRRRLPRCFKAYHQIVSVPEDNDDREVRISFSSHVQSGTGDGCIPNAHCSGNDCEHAYETKAQACAGGSCSCSRCCFTAGLEAGSALGPGRALPDVHRWRQVDPKRTLALVVRGGHGLAKWSRLLCSVPDAAVVNPAARRSPTSRDPVLTLRPGTVFGGHFELGTRSYVGFPGDGESLPLLLRTTGGCAGRLRGDSLATNTSQGPDLRLRSPPLPPPGAAPAPAAPGAPPRPPAPRPPPPAPIVMPDVTLHTAAFQAGFISQPSSPTIPPAMTM